MVIYSNKTWMAKSSLKNRHALGWDCALKLPIQFPCLFFLYAVLQCPSPQPSSYNWHSAAADLAVYTNFLLLLLQWSLMQRWIRRLSQTMWGARRTCTRTSGAPTTATATLGVAESSSPSMRYCTGWFLTGRIKNDAGSSCELWERSTTQPILASNVICCGFHSQLGNALVWSSFIALSLSVEDNDER